MFKMCFSMSPCLDSRGPCRIFDNNFNFRREAQSYPRGIWALCIVSSVRFVASWRCGCTLETRKQKDSWSTHPTSSRTVGFLPSCVLQNIRTGFRSTTDRYLARNRRWSCLVHASKPNRQTFLLPLTVSTSWKWSSGCLPRQLKALNPGTYRFDQFDQLDPPPRTWRWFQRAGQPNPRFWPERSTTNRIDYNVQWKCNVLYCSEGMCFAAKIHSRWTSPGTNVGNAAQLVGFQPFLQPQVCSCIPCLLELSESPARCRPSDIREPGQCPTVLESGVGLLQVSHSFAHKCC